MDRDGLATALRNARERIRPRDVGLPAGTRRPAPAPSTGSFDPQPSGCSTG